jgi:hypothetical protein
VHQEREHQAGDHRQRDSAVDEIGDGRPAQLRADAALGGDRASGYGRQATGEQRDVPEDAPSYRPCPAAGSGIETGQLGQGAVGFIRRLGVAGLVSNRNGTDIIVREPWDELTLVHRSGLDTAPRDDEGKPFCRLDSFDPTHVQVAYDGSVRCGSTRRKRPLCFGGLSPKRMYGPVDPPGMV